MDNDDFDYNSQNYYTIYTWKDTNSEELIEAQASCSHDNEDLLFEKHNNYNLFYQNQTYLMKIFDSPECCNYSSKLTDYDSSTYLMCLMEKFNADTKCKYIIIFGFNVESMKFLELLDLYSINKVGIIRECIDIDEIEKMLYNKQLMSIEEIEYLRSLV